jgi:flagellar protein FlbD
MITLHRLGHAAEPFLLNPDLIITVEANPDTVITLTNGTKIVVAEPPERVDEEVQACRVEILMDALRHQREERLAGSGVTSTPGPRPGADAGSGVAARRATLSILTAVEHQS